LNEGFTEVNCEICGKSCVNLLGLFVHLRAKHKDMLPQKYYDCFLLKKPEDLFCYMCGKPAKFNCVSKGYYKTCGSRECIKKLFKQTCLENHGVENPSQSKEVKLQKTKTCLENYGVEHPLQSEEIKVKFKKTCLEKYGVENPYQSEKAKEKSKETCLENYGVENPSQSKKVRVKYKQTCLEKLGVENPLQSEKVKEKGRQTCLERFGVEYASQSEEVKIKVRKTCLKKYGVEHASQSEEIHCKQTYGWKNYTLPSGNVVKVQGYENFVLDELFKTYTENDIIIDRKNVPKIWYNTIDDKKHRYFPDIFIPKENLIIEVKSTWTYERDFAKNLLKQAACLEAGFKFEFWIYKK